MERLLMRLKVLLPYRVFAEQEGVVRIVAETPSGAFGMLPRRRDCVAALAPGILTYETQEKGVAYIAVDEGILVKTGPEVLVSVRNAIGGADLGRLHQAVQQEFLTLGERERSVRYVLAKLENDLTRRLVEFSRHG